MASGLSRPVSSTTLFGMGGRGGSLGSAAAISAARSALTY